MAAVTGGGNGVGGTGGDGGGNGDKDQNPNFRDSLYFWKGKAKLVEATDSEEETLSDSEDYRQMQSMQRAACQAQIAAKEAEIAQIKEQLKLWNSPVTSLEPPSQISDSSKMYDAASILIRFKVDLEEEAEEEIRRKSIEGLKTYREKLLREVLQLKAEKESAGSYLDEATLARDRNLNLVAELQNQKAFLEAKLNVSASTLVGPSSSRPNLGSAARPSLSSVRRPVVSPGFGISEEMTAAVSLLLNLFMRDQFMRRPKGRPLMCDESAVGQRKTYQNMCKSLEAERNDLYYDIEKMRRKRKGVVEDISPLLSLINSLNSEIESLRKVEEKKKAEDERAREEERRKQG